MTLKAIYTLFAKNAPYVTPANPAVIDTSLQLTETNAPLNQKNVRSAIQNSLRRIVLTNYQASLSM